MKTLNFYMQMTFTISLLVSLSSCRKFLEIDNPRDKVVAEYAYNSDNSAIMVVTDLFYEVQSTWGQGLSGISINCGAAADELSVVPNSPPFGFYNNSAGESFWTLWSTIYKCNAAIEGLEGSEKLNSQVKTQLIGEAKFMRAFTYFYLVNLFGDIPLLTTTNYAVNSKAFRSSTSTIYEQIIEDLKAAQQMLNVNYVASDVRTTTNVKVRPNRSAATALLARTYLYTKDWANAEIASSELIDNTNYELSTDLDAVFLANSKEAIWQLEPQTGDFAGVYSNTADARHFVLSAAPNDPDRPVWISPHLERAFEIGDKRYGKWIAETNFDYPTDALEKPQFKYPFKYKINASNTPASEYLMVLRLAEQYLIRAEARINNGKVSEGLTDLNVLRQNRRSSPTTDIPNPLPDFTLEMSPEQARLAVEHERQVELFTEWGHRWLDLKRTGRIDQIMSTLNPAKYPEPWRSYVQLFSTPSDEMRLNKNLGQTTGYPN